MEGKDYKHTVQIQSNYDITKPNVKSISVTENTNTNKNAKSISVTGK